jgi:hypothetical protein
MAADEQDQQRKELLWEEHQANEEIARLIAEAKTLGELISKFGSWLQKSPAVNIYHRDQEQHGCHTECLPAEIHQAMKGWEQSFNIADRLRSLQWRLVGIRDRKICLGMM